MRQPLTFSASWHAWWLFKNIYQKTCQPGKRKIMCDLISVNKYLKAWCREDGASSAQGKDKRLWAQTQPQKVLSQHQQTLFHCEVDWAPAEIALGGCRVSILEDIQKPAPSGLSWAGGWTRWSLEVPSNLSHLVILLLHFTHQNISYCFWNYISAFQFLSRYSPPKASQQGKKKKPQSLSELPPPHSNLQWP